MKKLTQYLKTFALYFLGALAVCLTFFLAIQALYVSVVGLLVLLCVGGGIYLYNHWSNDKQ